ncbi:unnamed protein product [Prorocentrum cordatum]|uniref:Uncharacterized protein n=1 Tax=Prorocentrum cordatum TaxID=2364126 RepID=A0ABN9SSC2_9DINO|nr:unnamed protein product [Polarella glacialis]
MGRHHQAQLFDQVAARHCPGTRWSDGERLQRECGHNQVRLYQEKKLLCGGNLRAGAIALGEDAASHSLIECPQERRASSFQGLQFGIFEPGPERNVVAWSRFASCDTWGCNGGGWDESDETQP